MEGDNQNEIANKEEEKIAFYDPELFPFLQKIEENYKVILDELLENVKEHKYSLFEPWPEKELYEASNPLGWNVCGLFTIGVKLEENCKRFPNTTKLIEDIPGLASAAFSALMPRSHIEPHVGYADYSDKILRAHLGMIIPEKCVFVVNHEERVWKEGKMLVFDDTLLHEAWNRSDKVRIVLVIDFHLPQGFKTKGTMEKGFSNHVKSMIDNNFESFRKK